MNKKHIILGLAGLVAGTASVFGQFTLTSPTSKGALPGGVSIIGGLVYDIVGLNGNRVVAQTPASALFDGYFDTGSPVGYRGNPGTIGIQSGFTPAVTGALGGGIAEFAIRLTVWDGDTSVGDFDYYDNDLLVNGVNLGDFSDVQTILSNNNGTSFGSLVMGFSDSRLNTGFFYTTDSTKLAALYTSLISTQEVKTQLVDVDPYDNYFDFTQGLDSSLINVGTGPVVNPPVIPEPSTIGLLGFGAILGLVFYRRRVKAARKAA